MGRFRVNYVEACQTRDYRKIPQDYGGFHTLSEAQRERILDLTFGPDGLKPAIVKMFLDPFQEGMTKPEGGGASSFDHETTTKWMRYFVREGLKRTRARAPTSRSSPPCMARRRGRRNRNSCAVVTWTPPKERMLPGT